VQVERLPDPQARPPKHNDQRADAVAMQAAARLAHHSDDLLDPRRIRWMVHSLVPRGAAEVKFGGRGR